MLGATASTELKSDFGQSVEKVQYLTNRPVEAEASRLAAEISAPGALEEDSTRTTDDGTARQLTYSAAGGLTDYPDSLTVVVAPSKEMAGIVVNIVQQVLTDADTRLEAPAAAVEYEKDFGFEPPTSCISTGLSLDLGTYNPQVPLYTSIRMAWSCPGIDAAMLQGAVTTAMETDTRFEAEPWRPSGDTQLTQFMHAEARGQWTVLPPEPPSSPDPGLQLNLSAPTI